MHGQQIIRQVFALVLIPVMLWLFFNASANWHYHKLPTGEVVKHSHPFSPSPDGSGTPAPYQGHEHSAAEYICLDQYSNTDTHSPGGDAGFFYNANHCPATQEIGEHSHLLQFIPQNALRGPPSVS
jgi:hypothetical protein